VTNRQIVLKSRPVGEPVATDFELIEGPIPEPEAGQFVAQNIYLGLAPAARLRMSEGASYAAPTPLGSVVYGQSAGIVVASRNDRFQVGDKVVVTDGGWQDYTLTDGALATKVDEGKAPLASWLGVLGVSGQTAYGGLLLHGRPKPGETVVVSAASGAVGGAVGQIARIKGCRVIGIAGGAKKCAFVRETLGFDDCVDHRAAAFDAALRAACPNGVDVYFDNVGGAVRDAVFPLMNDFGRIVVCGLIAEYNSTTTRAGPDWFPILTRRLTIRGFLMRDHADIQPRFIEDVSGWLADRRIVAREDITRGLHRAPEAFIAMLLGRNFGKSLVEL